ncbi:MAG: DUF3750 domain-containing protein [Desulfopila sp.]|jgi:hypothetical protein|nr:DUF3750 domain-containing protein [Desulfopila sp.]
MFPVKRSLKLAAVLIIFFLVQGCSENSYHSASRESAGIAPDPLVERDAVLQVYGADAWGWRGWFAIHTWIAAKRTGEASYTVYDVVGWRGRHGSPVVRIRKDVPDRYWYGNKPRLLREHKGPHVDILIDAIEKAVFEYPWKKSYRAFPGPNSNTFTAWIGEKVPEMDLSLPLSAIGRGYVDTKKQN